MANRRDYGSGSVYQRCDARRGCPPRGEDGDRPSHKCRGLWVGTVEAGWTAEGRRRRIPVSAATKAEAAKRLARKRQQLERGEGVAGVSERTTVKQWVETYLVLRKQPPKALKPKAYGAAASPLNKWVVPTIGHRRISMLTPADIRAVDEAQYEAGLKTSTADATRRALMTALNWAIKEGHVVPPRVMKVPRPGMGVSDRLDVPVKDAIAIMEEGWKLPHGIRWVVAAGYGERQGEALGLTEECIDFDRNVIKIEWQLQTLKYVERGKPEKGFEIPRDMEVRHLHKAWHLTRPKSSAGVRELHMPDAFAEAMKIWLKARPANPWGLVFTTPNGLPIPDKVDREEWRKLQTAVGVAHPSGRPWHIHECRNLFATLLGEGDASDAVTTSLVGHASILTTRAYQRANEEPKRKAIEDVFKTLKIGDIVKALPGSG